MTKPGWKTTEFLFAVLACALSACLAFDIFPTGSAALRIVGAAGMFLTSLGYTVSRTSVKTNALRAIEAATKTTTTLLLVCIVLCSCGASVRGKAIDGGLLALNTARETFTTFDALHQQSIVDKATSLEDGKAQLASYRAQRVAVVEAFEVAYRALAVAALLNDDHSIADFEKAAKLVTEAINKLQGGTP